MSKVSVIVPIYNVESYLPKCIDSIISQTLFDIEIILVDDGSTDGGVDVCDEYASRDGRIKVVHKHNEGLSAARNDGIVQSSSPYLLFIDADDWIVPDLCDKALTAALENDADLVLFKYCRITSDGREKRMDFHIHSGLLTEEEALQFNNQYTPAIWLGLYRRELFDNIRFPDGKLFEEVGTSHRLKHDADRIYLIDEALYYYRVDRPGSIISTFGILDHPDLIEMKTRRAIDLFTWGYENLALEDAMFLLIRVGRDEQLIDIVNNVHSSDLNWKRKVMLAILKLSPNLFDAICNITGRRVKR